MNKQHTIAVFFDVERAYDLTWRHGILKKLHGMGVRGHLGWFLFNFLRDRRFRFRIGPFLSEQLVQENGTAQGSVLSVALFAVMINDIGDTLPSNVSRALFVDDFSIWVTVSRYSYFA